MTLIPHANHKSVPGPAELRGRFIRATGRLRETAVHLGRLMEDKTPDPVRAGALRTATRVRDTAARAGRLTGHHNLASTKARAGRAATLARANRTALATVAGVLTAAVLARRARRMK
ncbi:hypothetical protein ACFXD5_16065 [Streptomyces sp. NPDC059385]|uniref:hypothetical protein n=1 Tax=Streptomyces sp. NPDC059385 TaxID=3346817 RepID=UPI003690CB8A